ncbi:MAG TPA: hypothetical protein VM183_06940 [Burkholderiales bacterium]|nr:hypothetical protein [Burkholderiales bacterium]
MDLSLSKTALRRTARDVAGIVALSLLVAMAALDFGPLPPWIAPGMALAALGLAVMCALRLRALEFAPEVLAGDVIVPRPSRAGREVKLLLPLQFVNSGAADGVVEWVALRLTIDGDLNRSVLLSPVAEVDMQRFIQAKRRLDESAVEPFTGFALEGKRSVAKFVLFDLAEKARSQPLSLRPGRYAFELFVKSTANRTPKLERAFEHVVEPKHIEEFANDAPVYLINYQMTLPGARREMTGAEWMPRATRYSN